MSSLTVTPTSCSFFLMGQRPPPSTLFPYTTLSRSPAALYAHGVRWRNWPCARRQRVRERTGRHRAGCEPAGRSEEHTSELQSRGHLVCRLLLEKKKKYINRKRSLRSNPYTKWKETL